MIDLRQEVKGASQRKGNTMNEIEIQFFRKDIQDWETRYFFQGTVAQAIKYMETEVVPQSPRGRSEWRVR